MKMLSVAIYMCVGVLTCALRAGEPEKKQFKAFDERECKTVKAVAKPLSWDAIPEVCAGIMDAVYAQDPCMHEGRPSRVLRCDDFNVAYMVSLVHNNSKDQLGAAWLSADTRTMSGRKLEAGGETETVYYYHVLQSECDSSPRPTKKMLSEAYGQMLQLFKGGWRRECVGCPCGCCRG